VALHRFQYQSVPGAFEYATSCSKRSLPSLYHACRLMGLGRSTHRYRARKAKRDSALRIRLKELAARRMRFGYRRLTAMLLREGMPANHKRVYQCTGCTARKVWR